MGLFSIPDEAHYYRETPERRASVDVVNGSIYGWRMFWLRGADGAIVSPTQRERWWSAERKAKCSHRGSGRYIGRLHTPESPDWDCSCGLYMYAELRELRTNSHLYIAKPEPTYSPHPGAMLHWTAWSYCRVWGKVVLADYGVRAQYMEIMHMFSDAPVSVRDKTRLAYPSVKINSILHLDDHPAARKRDTENLDLTDRVIPSVEVPAEMMKKFIPKLKKPLDLKSDYDVTHDNPWRARPGSIISAGAARPSPVAAPTGPTCTVQFGIYRQNGFPLDVKPPLTIAALRASRATLWGIPPDAEAYNGSTKLDATYVIKAGDNIEFHRRYVRP